MATKQEFFFTKVTLQSITNTVLSDFWLMLLYWVFISSCTTIYFFVKKFIFTNVYNSVNRNSNVLICFLVEKRAISQVRTHLVGDGEVHPKCVQKRTGGRGMPRLMCTYTFTLSRFMFLATFLSYSVLFYLQKFNLTIIQKKETVLFFQQDQFLSLWNKLFLLNIIFVNQS